MPFSINYKSKEKCSSLSSLFFLFQQAPPPSSCTNRSFIEEASSITPIAPLLDPIKQDSNINKKRSIKLKRAPFSAAVSDKSPSKKKDPPQFTTFTSISQRKWESQLFWPSSSSSPPFYMQL